MAERGRSGGRDTPAPQVAAWEWVAAAVGLVLVLGTAGYLVWDAAGSERAGPDIVVQVEAVLPAGGAYRVEFRARNRGDRTPPRCSWKGRCGGARRRWRPAGRCSTSGQPVARRRASCARLPGR